MGAGLRQVFQAHLGKQGGDVRLFVAQIQGLHLHVFLAGGQFVKQGQFRAAGRAPQRPEIEENDFVCRRVSHHVFQRHGLLGGLETGGQGAGRFAVCGGGRGCLRRVLFVAFRRGGFGSGAAFAIAQHLVQRLGQAFGANLVIKHVHQLAIGADEVDQGAVIDGVAHAWLRVVHFLAVHAVAEGGAQLIRQSLNIFHLARQADDALVKKAGVGVEALYVVIHRIDGDEDGLDGVRVFEGLHDQAIFIQRGRANVRAGGVANGQKQVFARVALLRDRPVCVPEIKRDVARLGGASPQSEYAKANCHPLPEHVHHCVSLPE